MYYLPIKISIYGPVNALMWYDMTCARNLYVNVVEVGWICIRPVLCKNLYIKWMLMHMKSLCISIYSFSGHCALFAFLQCWLQMKHARTLHTQYCTFMLLQMHTEKPWFVSRHLCNPSNAAKNRLYSETGSSEVVYISVEH